VNIVVVFLACGGFFDISVGFIVVKNLCVFVVCKFLVCVKNSTLLSVSVLHDVVFPRTQAGFIVVNIMVVLLLGIILGMW